MPLDYLDDKKGKFAESIKMMQVIAVAKYPDTKVFLVSSLWQKKARQLFL